MGTAIFESSIGKRLGKSSKLGMFIRSTKKKPSLSVSVDDIKMAGKTENIDPMWKVLMKDIDFGEPHHFLTMYFWAALKENVRSARILWIITAVCSNQGFLPGLQKNCQKQKPRGNLMPKRYLHGPVTWKVMRRNVWTDCELAKKTTEQLYKVATPCMDDHQFREEENGSVGELSTVCSHTVLKCLFLARIGRLDIVWSVNKRLTRLISYIHHTCDYSQYCYAGNTAQHCRLGLSEDSDFAGDLEESKSTSGGILCIFGSRTFVPISWMCKKQTSVSHSSTEAEVISPDAGLRMERIHALTLWDLVSEIFHSSRKPHQQNQICKKATVKLVGKSSAKTFENKSQPRTPIPI